MTSDKGVFETASVVAIAVVALVGLAVAGAGTAAAGPDFQFADDGDTPDFDFGGGDGLDFDFGNDSDGPDFGGISDGDEPQFDFGNESDTPDFGGISDGDEPDFGFGDDSDAPDFGFGDGDAPEFDFGDGDGPDFGNGDDNQTTQPPNFQVSVDSTNSPVTEGETLTVDATVTNMGGSADTQTVDLSVGGSQRDSTSVNLAAGASQTVSLSWATASGDAGDYTASVASENQTATTPVSVDTQVTPPNFQVSIDATNSPVVEGDTLTVDATLQNTGGSAGTQTVTLDVAGSQRDSRSVNLASGGSQTISLSWATASGDAGNYQATVAGENDSATADVSVTQQVTPPNFDVSITGTNSPVTEGDPLSVTAQVTNTGGSADTQTISLAVGGSQRDSTSVNLAPGNSATVTLNWATGSGDAGSYTATVASTNSSDSTSVQVQAPTQYESFTAVTEDGYLQLGRGSDQTLFEFNECPGGNPVGGPEDPADLPNYQANNSQCIEFTADYHPGNGTYTIAPEDFHFPDLKFYSQTLGRNLTVKVSAPSGLSGTINPDTGEGTFSGNMRSDIPELAEGCGMDVVVSGTTGTSGPLTGSPDPANSSGVAQPSLVDGEFAVPASTGCGLFGPAVNGEVPLPSDSGENELVMDLLLQFNETDP